MGLKKEVQQCPMRLWKEVWPHPWDSGCRTNIGFFVRVTPVLIVTLAVLVVVLSLDSLLKTDEASGTPFRLPPNKILILILILIFKVTQRWNMRATRTKQRRYFL